MEADPSLSWVLNERSLFTMYQPIVDHQRLTVIGYEALSRPHLGGHVLAPERFFQSAGMQHRHLEVDLLALRTAVGTIQESPLARATLFINVMPPTLLEKKFIPSLLQLLKEYGCAAQQIVIEIIEYISYDLRVLAPILRELEAHGIRVALDDVNLQEMGMDEWNAFTPAYVKLDRKMIQGISVSQHKQRMLDEALQQLPWQDRVIVEGIEHEEDLHYIEQLGIRYSQGFYFGLPMTLRQMPWLQSTIALQRHELFLLSRQRSTKKEEILKKSQMLDLNLLAFHAFNGDL
nr:EAL domain-containing protein [Sulfoacidibacillus thermotolerans]